MAKYGMDDISDHEGKISLFALATRPKYQRDDPRYLSPDAVARIARHRIEQMEREAAANVAALKALEKKKS